VCRVLDPNHQIIPGKRDGNIGQTDANSECQRIPASVRRDLLIAACYPDETARIRNPLERPVIVVDRVGAVAAVDGIGVAGPPYAPMVPSFGTKLTARFEPSSFV
jgi:hypothetical protein